MGRPLLFALNGERVELTEVDPRTTVLQYIRSQTSLQGTKLVCGEGGCGACTVLLSKYDPNSKCVEELSINSCLAPLCSIDGCAVTTTEGLKSSKGELHAVHKRLGGFHASQCGFCTPGMSMSIYAGLRKASCKSGAQSGGDQCKGPSSLPGLTAVDAAKCISGNICRCTGYRPLIDTCKSFACDVDVEDLGLNSFWEAKQRADASLLPAYDPEQDPKFPSFLVDELESRVGKENLESAQTGLSFKHVAGPDPAAERLWLTASSLADAFSLLEEYSKTDRVVTLVVGNTSSGVYKDIKPQVYIDISQIPELQVVKTTEESVQVGAGVSITKLIELLEGQSENIIYTGLTKHLKKIASPQVRNRASLGGNLILAQKLGFDSDLATILLGAGTEVTLASSRGHSTILLEKFLSQCDLEPGTLLVSIRIPSWNDVLKEAGAKVLFNTYRAAVRPEGNAVSYVNAALLAITDKTETEQLVVRDLRLAFGAFGGAHAILARNTEKVLVGKPVTPAGLLQAVKVLKEEIKPSREVHKAAYRNSVAVGFLFDFFNSFLLSPGAEAEDLSLAVEDLAEDEAHGLPNQTDGSDGVSSAPILSNGIASVEEDGPGQQVVEFGSINPKLRSGPTPSFASQKFAITKNFWPVAQPSKKIMVELQASGEAAYVDDILPVKGTLYASIVLNDNQPGKVLSIDASEAMRSPGVVDFISAKDIPGVNHAYSFFFLEDRLFVEDQVECVNDTLGVVVADSYENAKDAASKVKVDLEPLANPIYSIEEAIANESFGELGFWKHVADHSFGELPVKADHRIENGQVYSGSQYNFYLEAQSAYAIPEEDGCITIYSANQAPNVIQNAVAILLGIPMNSVRVITRRLGGGFGGKITRAAQVAAACALAAYKLKRPVKMYLDRQTDMRMCPGRHETKAIYSVDFNGDGKVKGLEVQVFVDGGRTKDSSPMVLMGLSNGLRQYNWESLKSSAKICKTNKVNRTIMRGPGDIQGHFIAETIIEHVAGYLGMDPHKVRERNMHSLESLNKFFPQTKNSEISLTVPYLWQKLKETSKFEKRKLAVERFNAKSKWVKKGIDMVVGLYETGNITKEARVSIYEDGSVVVEVGGVEMGQGLWTKVKQAVSYALSLLWGHEAHPMERVDMSRIRIVQNDTISLANSEPTGGSTGSEASCQAAISACGILVERLQPFLEQLRKNGASPAPWEAIVGMAKFGGASLSAQGKFSADLTSGYLNFGAGVSEVTVDVLTGSTTILRTDLLYDCGKSLNPAVDIGQVEGAFVMGVGFYMTEEWREDRGKILSNSTWEYKPPAVDNFPKRFHVELSNTKANQDRILSSKASGEPPILLAKSVHSAVRHAITAARQDLQHHLLPEAEGNGNLDKKWGNYFRLDCPATMDTVKGLCGLDNVEKYLASMQ